MIIKDIVMARSCLHLGRPLAPSSWLRPTLRRLESEEGGDDD